MTTFAQICTVFWPATEYDRDFKVNHYCWRDEGHDGPHVCECGAECELEVTV